MLLCVGGCTAPTTPPQPTPPPAPPPGPTASGADLGTLRRPWTQPTLAAGSACPVTTAVSQPDPGLGPMLGDGPARAVGLGAGAVLDYMSPHDRSDWTDKTWAGQKVLWAIDPGVTGPVLIRGRQIDGPGRLGFEDPAQPELVLNLDSYEGQPGGWKDNPSLTRLKGPGCYAYQIDTAQGSSSIVFLARGPKL